MANKKISELDGRASLTLADLLVVGDPTTGYAYKITVNDLKAVTGAGVISFNGRVGAVVPAEGDYSLTQLSDVIITSAASGEYTRYNGSNWVNSTIQAGDIPDIGGTYVTLTTTQTISGAKTFTNDVRIDSGAATKRLILDADNNVARIFSFRTDDLQRWAIRVDGNETGSNAGADFAIRRYNDAGTFLDAPIQITRSTGAIRINHDITMWEDGVNNGDSRKIYFRALGDTGQVQTAYITLDGYDGTNGEYLQVSAANIRLSATTGNVSIVGTTPTVSTTSSNGMRILAYSTTNGIKLVQGYNQVSGDVLSVFNNSNSKIFSIAAADSAVTVSSLAGTGSRMVVASATGVLSTQSIPVGTVTSVGLTTGTSGTDVNVSGSPVTGSGSITLNIPDASATNRGVVTTGTQTIAGAKTFQVSGTYVDLARFYNDTNNKSLFVYADASGTGLSNLTNFGGESIYFYRTNTEIQFSINGSLRARLITGGRFLLGSQFYTDDGVSLLQVNGQIRAGFTAATSAATRIVTVNSSDVMETRTPSEILSDIAALPLAGGTLTGALNGTSAIFSSSVRASAIYLTNMTAGSGALYYNTGASRLTLANYNASGIIRFETNGGVDAGTINADQTWTFPAQINGLTAQFTGSVTTPAGFYIDLNTYLYEGILQLTDLVNKKNILKFTASTSGHYINSLFLAGGSQQPIYISAKSTAGQNVIFNTDGTTTFSHALSGTSATFISGVSAIGQEQAITFQRTTGTASDVYSFNADSSGAYLYNNTTSKVLTYWTEGGNIGIGTDLPSLPNGGGLILYKSDYPRLQFKNSTSGDGSLDGAGFFLSGNNFYISNRESGDLVFEATANQERMRILASGDMYLTGRSTNGDYGMYFYSNDTDSRIYSSNSGAVSKSLIFYTSGNPRMTITSGGNVGIGNTTVNASSGYKMLAINGTTGGEILIQSNGTDAGYMYANSGIFVIDAIGNYPLRFRTNAGNRMEISGGGRVGITTNVNATESTSQFYIDGSGYTGYHWLDSTAYYIGQNSSLRELRMYSGTTTAGVKLTNGSTSWGTYSDERLKTNIEDIGSVLDKVKDLRTVKYHLKDVDAKDRQKRYGLIAQDLVGKFDEVLGLSKYSDEIIEEYYDLRYTELVPVLFKAIQEQQAQIEELKAKLN